MRESRVPICAIDLSPFFGPLVSQKIPSSLARECVEIEATPALDNPKSSALAAYTVLSLLKRLSPPLKIYV
jgi:hypothetical protein